MAFFLILPSWVLCLLTGIVLVSFEKFRRAGFYVINMSSAATALSLSLSTAVLFLGPRVGLQRMGQWAGVVLIAAYLVAIVVGGLAGAVGGFLVTRRRVRPEGS
jgi:hypothetical protein